jgi:hypothetical protein
MEQMAFNCTFRHDYVKIADEVSIRKLIHEALNGIHIHLYSEAKLPEQSVFRRISRELAIAESRGSYRGLWNQNRKQMTFVDELWCVSTVVHETLHAASSIQALEEAIALKPLFEGITECLTGYILSKEYDYVYANCWKNDQASLCRISDLYRPNCSRWGAFFHFVPIKTALPLYFEPTPNWSERCMRFAEAVRRSGYNAFRDVLKDALSSLNPTTDFMFWAECRRTFGKRFVVLSGTPTGLDFSTIH